ncbi:hypothetical protein P7K49_009974, partial [Saguinus oedipus]
RNPISLDLNEEEAAAAAAAEALGWGKLAAEAQPRRPRAPRCQPILRTPPADTADAPRVAERLPGRGGGAPRSAVPRTEPRGAPGTWRLPEPGEPGRASPAARLLHAGPQLRAPAGAPPGRLRAPRAPRRAAAPSMHRLMGVNSTAAAAAGQPNVSCTCNCKRSLFQSMEINSVGLGPCVRAQLRAGVQAERAPSDRTPCAPAAPAAPRARPPGSRQLAAGPALSRGAASLARPPLSAPRPPLLGPGAQQRRSAREGPGGRI